MRTETGKRAATAAASSVRSNDEMERSEKNGRRAGAHRVLVCFTGSVASVKAYEVVDGFLDGTNRSLDDTIVDVPLPFDVRVIVTDVAKRFVDVEELRRRIKTRYAAFRAAAGSAAYAERFPDGHPPDEPFVYTDDTEWREWRKVGDPVTHIELRKWADALVVAPLSANTLAKMANGLCDTLLTCVWRAWDFADASKSVFVAPAMNTAMWNSPFTAKHLAELAAFPNVHVIDPVEKTLACGDVGVGAMASPETVARAVVENRTGPGRVGFPKKPSP